MSYATDSRRPDLGGNMKFGDPHSWSPVVWRYLAERFAVRSMLDVGCGEGHTVHFFRSLGVHAHGIDGLQDNISRAVIPIALHDLLRGPYIMPVDLVWSCEVAEHIDEDRVDHYLDTLANGRIIAMTHAIPGQPGHHHVNCQPAEYWIRKLEARGYMISPDTDIVREVARREATWTFFGNTGLLFTRG